MLDLLFEVYLGINGVHILRDDSRQKFDASF
jgi:hypothetical protein